MVIQEIDMNEVKETEEVDKKTIEIRNENRGVDIVQDQGTEKGQDVIVTEMDIDIDHDQRKKKRRKKKRKKRKRNVKECQNQDHDHLIEVKSQEGKNHQTTGTFHHLALNTSLLCNTKPCKLLVKFLLLFLLPQELLLFQLWAAQLQDKQGDYMLVCLIIDKFLKKCLKIDFSFFIRKYTVWLQ